MARPRHDAELARWARDGRTGSEPVPAATVVVLRDAVAGDRVETLMLRKTSKVAFGGMWVFPGGRVDESDTAGLPPGDDLSHARVAAVREAREEAGLELGAPDLVPLAHWTPPATTPRRFLTWFFLARAPRQDIAIDHGEIREYAWMSASEALERRDSGAIELAPPTFVTLHHLSRARDVATALADAQRRPPERFATRIVPTDTGPIALWRGDAGWDDGDPAREGARHRLFMRPDRWTYERSPED